MSKLISFSKTKTGLIVIAVVVIIVIVSIFTLNNGKSNLEAFVVERRTISEEVSVSGRVEAAVDVDLSFERSGQIASIPLKVGDNVNAGQTIITLGNSSQVARLAQAEADLQLERIKLQELMGGSSGSDITASQNDLRLAGLEFDNAKASLIEKIKETLLETNNAIKNNADRLFEGGSFGATLTSGSIKYFFSTGDNTKKILINGGRSEVGRILEKNWKNIDIENKPEQSATLILSDLLTIQDFLNDLADVVNDISEPEDSTIKSSFNSLKDNVTTAISSVNSSLSELRSALQTYRVENADLNYVSSQTSPKGEDTRLQEARVQSAEAKVAAELATLNEGIIRSPVLGKVTSIKTRIGEVVDANKPVVTVVSDALYEIVINIPEADISKVGVSDIAEITLDAYSDNDLFFAKVISIDLSETIVDGVATYEAKLQFKEEDPRIRSGMTANVNIFGEIRNDVLAVPQKAVTLKDGKRIVRILENEEEKEITVETGINADGYIEILSGLKEGQQILIED